MSSGADSFRQAGYFLAGQVRDRDDQAARTRDVVFEINDRVERVGKSLQKDEG